MKKTNTEKIREMKDNFVDNCKNMVNGGSTMKYNFDMPKFNLDLDNAPEEPKMAVESNLAKVNRFEENLETKMRDIEDAVKELRRFVL